MPDLRAKTEPPYSNHATRRLGSVFVAWVTFVAASWGLSALLLRLDYGLRGATPAQAVESIRETIRMNDGVNMALAAFLGVIYAVGRLYFFRRDLSGMSEIFLKPGTSGIVCTILVSIYGLTIGRVADETAFNQVAGLFVLTLPLVAMGIVNQVWPRFHRGSRNSSGNLGGA